MKKTVLWFAAVVITLFSVVYQRMTGPTYPVQGNLNIETDTVSYKLIRSYNKPNDAPVKLDIANEKITGYFLYKRTPSHDDWQKLPLKREGEYLTANIPQQPPAGKVMYQIFLEKGNNKYALGEKPVVIRFRGDVPAWVLIPHIIFMFAAMLFSTRTGLAAVMKEKTFHLTLITIATLFAGGLILGPVVQKYAFDAYWTGWPLGTDLTDNKTAFAFLFWLVAFVKTYRNPYHRSWVIIASLVLLFIYLIPHSMMGSEIDFTETESEALVLGFGG